MKYKYKTTFAKYSQFQGKLSAPDPFPPNSDEDEDFDWELVGSTAADMTLFWFWRAKLPQSRVGKTSRVTQD